MASSLSSPEFDQVFLALFVHCLSFAVISLISQLERSFNEQFSLLQRQTLAASTAATAARSEILRRGDQSWREATSIVGLLFMNSAI